jgi:PEGA domain
MHAKFLPQGNFHGSRSAGIGLKAIVMGLLAISFFVSIAAAQKAKKPLSKDDVVGLLEGDVEPARVADVVRSEGIKFEMNAATEKEIRDAGGDENLINVLMELSPKAKTPPVNSSTPPSSPKTSMSAPVLLIEATPGSAQVYIDDEPKATTSPEGRVKFSQLSPGLHVIRLSRAGYTDYEQKVELKVGEQSTVYATLAAVKTASVTPPASSQTPTQPPVSNNPLAGGGQSPPATNAKIYSFLVAHDHGFPAGSYCEGTMTVGNGKILFQGVRAFASYQAGGPTHSLDISADEIKEVKKNNVYLAQIGGFHIKLKNGTNINLVVLDAQGKFQAPFAIVTAVESQMHVSLK